MKTILIAEPCEETRIGLEAELKRKYQVLCCTDGHTSFRLLQEHRPDGLILNLNLRGMDGLTLLEAAKDLRPQAILTLSTIYPPYVQHRLYDLGVSYALLIPASIWAIVKRMDDILQLTDYPTLPNQQQITASHLHRLGLPYWNGYQMLRVGVPLYHQDHTQSFTKELYPAIAVLCDCCNWEQVESSVRNVIQAGWDNRNDEIWRQYFSDISRRPTNKKFIARLSELLDA